MTAAALTPERKWVGTWSYVHYLCNLLLTLFLAVSFAASMAHAQLPGTPLNVPATLEAETATPAPGQSVTLAFRFKPKPGWHGYWENPGDAGFGMQLKWSLPQGVTAGRPQYPVPQPLVISGLMNHVFEHEYAVLLDLTLDKHIAAGTLLPVKVRGDWLSCTNEICVPEGGDMSIELVAGNGGQAAQGRFDTYRAALPVPLDRTGVYAIDGKTIQIAIPFSASAGASDVYFFPRTEKLFRYAAPQSARRRGDWLIIRGEVEVGFDGNIKGLLRFNNGQGLDINAVPGTVPVGGETVEVIGSAASVTTYAPLGNFALILGFAVLGGLILNLMPCVFPILGLKALSLAKAGGDERDARRDALAYSGGVIVSCVALGGLLLTLRAGGQEVGWAFQLQEPAIVLLLLLLMILVTANLSGLFEIGSISAGEGLTRKGGLVGSFWTGVLASVVATPCTGPFMAAALGAALLLPVPQALLLFSGLGFGLALPFLGIAYVPALRRKLPKPGPWLNKFRKAMAVPMGLTALALLWLLWRLSGNWALVVGALAAILMLLCAWEIGRAQRRPQGLRVPVLVTLGLIGTLLFSAVLWEVPEPDKNARSSPDLLKSERFTEALLAKYREDGRNVFVYFTADWCVTCKLNEAAAIDREETKSAFENAGTLTLKGDFTRRDAAIARFLSKHGRSGVPLYLYYPAGDEAQVLPQVLTVGTLTDLPK